MSMDNSRTEYLNHVENMIEVRKAFRKLLASLDASKEAFESVDTVIAICIDINPFVRQEGMTALRAIKDTLSLKISEL